MQKKFFSLAEANALLPVLEMELIALQQLQKEFQYNLKELKRIKTAHKLQENDQNDYIFLGESKLDFMEIQAQLHVSNILSTGALLKDIDMGLLDFPSIRNGEEILLCWKQGETEITHYHGENEGFIGRKPLL